MSDTTENATTENTNPNYLAMSDEDFAKMPIQSFDEPTSSEVEGEEGSSTEAVADAGVPDTSETGDEVGESNTDPDNQDDPVVEETENESASESETNTEANEASTDDSGDSGSSDDPDSTKTDEPDFKSFYEKVTQEFKANGRMMKIDNPDDAIQLMQMGADYNRKMAGMKPGLKVLKMLEKNELLDESKLSYLIDLSQGNPQAITKLLADSKVDPMDLKPEEAGDYKSSDHSVDERELALDEVISDLQSSEHYPKLINAVSKQWDEKSKQTIADEPQLLRVLNDHMALGIYDIVSTEIENERMLGRLNGVSDLEAYRTVGDSIAARGGFAHLTQSSAETEKNEESPKTVTVTAKKKEDSERKDKRRAASPSKTTVAKPEDDFNPLSMSDEEYAKRYANKFL